MNALDIAEEALRRIANYDYDDHAQWKIARDALAAIAAQAEPVAQDERNQFEAAMRASDPTHTLVFDFARHEVRTGYAGYIDKNAESVFFGWVLAGRASTAVSAAQPVGEAVAPWPDFAGNPIREGDTIIHPDGESKAVVMYWPEFADAGDAWRARYSDGVIIRLCLQIGDKGRAVVQRAITPSAPPVAQDQDAALSKFDRECLSIGQQLMRAAGELPEWWEIRVEVERGAGTVTLYNEDGDKCAFVEDHDNLSETIECAIDAAMQSEVKNVPDA